MRAKPILTRKERIVLAALGSGLTCRQVARVIYVSRSDIGHCVQAIKRKLGGRTIAQNVVIAYSLGYFTEPDDEGKIAPRSLEQAVKDQSTTDS